MALRRGRINRLGKRPAVLLAAASAAASFTNPVWAHDNTFTFTSGGTSWSNLGAWLFGNPFPNGVNETANFTAVDLAPIAPIQIPINLDVSVTLGTLNFGDTNSATPGGWVLTSGLSTLTMDNGLTTAPIINVNNLGTNTAVSFVDIQVPIYGPNAFQKTGNSTLRLSAANQFGGTLDINAGTVEVRSLANLSLAAQPFIILSGGTLSLRSDTPFNLSGKTLRVTGTGGLYVDRNTSTVSGVTDNIGTVVMGSGNRTLAVGGGNFFGVNIGTLVLDAANTGAVLNELAPGQLTIGNVFTNNTAASTLSIGGTGTNTTGANLVVTNSIRQNAAGTLSVLYSDTHQLTVGSFDGLTGNLIISSNGALVVNTGKLPSGSLGVQSGTLDFSATSQDSTVTHLSLGGINNNAGGYINTGASSTLSVNGNVTFSASTNGLGSTIDGKLNLGTGLHSLQINGITGIPTQEVTVNAVTNGSGTLVKGGPGQILLTGANNLSAAVVVNQGTFSGAARASGNAMSSGAATISGGTLRLVNQTASAGSGTIGSLDFNGAATSPAFLMVDSGTLNPSATTTLRIGVFKGRASNTTGALTIIPRNGGLDSSEAIFAGSIAPEVGPVQNHGILAPYVAAQVSFSNTSIDFLGTTGTAPNIRIGGGGAAYKTDSINNYTGGTAVFFANNVSSDVNTTGRSLFALKSDGTAANITGSGSGTVLTLGDGNLAGLIVNNGGRVSVPNMAINAAEAVFWAGGQILDVDGTTVLAAGGTINSNLSFASTTQGALTTSGAQTLNFTGGFNLGGTAVTRTVTVSGGTAIFSGALSNGNLTKAGPNYLILNGNNSAYGGAMRVTTGTLQIGQGTLSGTATLGASASVTLDNGNLVFDLDGQRSLGNFITQTGSGTGGVIVDAPTGILSFTNASSNFSSLTIQSGNVRLSATNQLPNAATLTLQGTGSFDMNGSSQTIGALNGGTNSVGTGYITNNQGVTSTLTINRTVNDTSTYNGSIRDGNAPIALDKLGIGTQILAGSNSYTGGTRLVAGTLQLNNGNGAGSGSIQFVGGNFAVGNGANVPNTLNIGSGVGTIGVAPGSNTGTLSGPINVSNGTLVVSFNGTGGTLSVLAASLAPSVFSGTILSSGTGSGVFRIPANTDASLASFIWGTSTSQINLGATTTVGFLSGGANGSILTGQLSVGALGGESSWNGLITSGTVTKIGPGTFTLSSASNKNHTINNLNANAGVMVVGQNAQLTNAINVTIRNGDLYFQGNANFTNTATMNLSTTNVWDVTQVPTTYAGAPGLTVQGTGTIRGAYIHGSGTLNPGGTSRAGTITFNTLANPAPVTMSNGFVQLDFGNSGSSSIGGGTNDLLVVNGDINFSPSTFYRFNYIGSGSVNAGDDYPFLYYTGDKTGWGPGGTSTTAGQVRSPFRADMVLKEVAPHFIAAHVNSIGNNAQMITWTGTNSTTWDLNLTANFKNTVGTGTTFFQLDTVVFDDSAIAKPTVQLETAVFLPAAVIVNNGSNAAGIIRIGGANNFAVGAGGTLTGSMKLIKNGTGQLELNGYNSYTGGSVLNSGTVVISPQAWSERLYDHAEAAGLGVGSILFTSTTGAATLTSNWNIPNDIHVPAGVIANLNSIGGGAAGMYFTAPIVGSGTINFFATGGQIFLRNTMDFFTGSVNVLGTVNFAQSTSVGSNINWTAATPQRFNFNWGNDFNAGDSAAMDVNLAGLNGPANVISVASGRRPGTLHIGSGNGDSLWTGGSSDAVPGGNGNGAYSPGNGIMSLTKEGTGSLTMTGSHGYTGVTTVNNGVLQLSNTGGAGGTPTATGGLMTATRQVIVRGGTFRLGTPGGGLLAGNTGTILTSTSGLLLSADSGGTIDVSNSYDANEIFDNTDPNFPVLIGYGAFKTADAVTWAGNGGNVLGTIRHQGGTISPGKDSGAGSFGSLNFVNTLEVRGGTMMLDIGSQTSNRDLITADTINIDAGTVVVNVVGGSAATNSLYTIMQGTNFFGSASSMQLVVKGRGATGTLQQSGTNVQLKILTPGTKAAITWAGANGGTWDVRSSQSWLNSTNTSDFFYHGDTVTFNDAGAGSIALAGNLMPSGEVRVNNSGTNTWAFAGPGKIGGTASLHKMGSGTLKLIGFHDYTGGTTIDAGGTLVLGADNAYPANGTGAAANLPLFLANHGGQAGTGSIVNNGTLVVAGATAMVVPNNISGGGAVYFRDIGTTRLDGTNSWLGGTTISNGIVALGRDNALPSIGSINMVSRDAANVYNAGPSTAFATSPRIDLRGFEQTILELSSFGGANTGSFNYIYNSNAGTQQISTLTIGRTGPGGWHGTIRENLDGDGANTCMVALTKMSDGSAFGGVATIDATGNTQAYNYAGLTNINAGTYNFIGTHSPANVGRITSAHEFGTYTIASGAALGGSFNIQSTVSVQPGGKLAPGWEGATTPHTASQDFLKLNSSELYLGLYGFTSDLITIPWDNGLTVQGVSQVHLNGVNVQAGTFTLLNYSGAALPDLLNFIQLNPLNITNPGTFQYILVNNIPNTSLDLVVTQPIVSTTWQTDGNSTWSGGQNWTSNPTTPNAFGSTANFGSISAPRTVTMDGPFNIGTANFNSTFSFTIVGAGNTTLSMGNLTAGSFVAINVTQGSHAINVPVAWDNDGTINVSANATLSIGGGFGLTAIGNSNGRAVVKDGAGTLLVDSVRNAFGDDGTALFRVKQGTVRMLHHSTANTNSSKVNSLAIDNGAKLDLSNNTMVIDFTSLGGAGSLLTQIRGWLNSADGRLYSSEPDTSGPLATRGIGYRDNTDSSGAGNKAVGNFGGVTVDSTALLMKYTYLGDTNVDGQVDINDLYNLASNYNPSHAGGANAIWQKGDFNYDGYVDLTDLSKLTTNWQQGVGNPLGSGLDGGLGAILTSLGLPNIAVPEPSAIGLVGLGLTGLMARRKRRA